MKHLNQWPRRTVRIAMTIFCTVVLGLSTLVYAGPGDTPQDPAGDSAITNGASLHNPNFDNHIWYEFNKRYEYGTLTPASWMPDDDTEGGPQDWRIWFMDGTVPILTWASNDEEATSTDKAIKSRTYWGGQYQAGIYQVIPNVTPCLTYQFQMYGKFKPSDGGVLQDLKVGIDQVGHTPQDGPAIHDDFPSTTLWGTSHTEYSGYYGALNATAEAWGDTITVYVYAEANGGEVLWDTGSFSEVTTGLLSDPDNPPAESGISGLSVSLSTTSATINWNTSGGAISQVFYHSVPSSSTPMTLTHTVYLPLVMSGGSDTWQSTAIDKTPSTGHSIQLISLQADTEYEFIVVSKGLSGNTCATWSKSGSFTTNN